MPKLLIYHNLIAPYKVVFFKNIALQFPGKVKILTSSKKWVKKEWRKYEIPASNLTIKRIPGGNLLPGIYWYNPTIFPRVLKEDFNILMTGDYHFLSSLLATKAAKIRGKPVALYTVKTKFSQFELNPSIDHLLTVSLIRDLIREYDLYITPSETSVSHLMEMGVKKEKIVKIPNPVDINKFNPQVKAKKKFQEYKESDVPILCYVGRLSKAKGIHYLIKAVAKSNLEMKVVIVGEGKEKKELINLCKQYGLEERISFLGQLPHYLIPKIHAISDVFVLPSIPTKHNVEQFPNALLEAMASALPCVTFDIKGGIKEIHKAGITGKKAKKISVSSLSNTIEELLSEDYLKYGRNARKRIVKKFSPQKVGSMYSNALMKVIREEHPYQE